jgi:transcriptional regulator GlxA family with amidase domain
MKANCEGSLALEDIAKHVGVSVSHFSLIFKKKIGVSPINYFHQIKIQKACEYLKYTDILIKEIAFKIGILDTQYFSRLFTKIIGVSPNQYRKNESPLE